MPKARVFAKLTSGIWCKTMLKICHAKSIFK